MTDQLVKRFVAPTMTRALELVQRELGPEAVILSSRKVDKGVEIVTSVEPDLPTRGIDVRREFGQNFDADFDRALPSDEAWRAQAGIEKAAAEFGGTHEVPERLKRDPAQLAQEIEAARQKMFAAKRRAQEEEEARFGGIAIPQKAMNQPAHQQPNEYTAQLAKSKAPSYEEIAQQEAAKAARAAAVDPLDPHGFGRSIAPSTPAGMTLEEQVRFESLQNDIADMRMMLEQQLWKMSEQGGTSFSNISMPQQVSMSNHYSVLSEHLERLGLSESLIDSLVSQVDHQGRASAAWRECMGILAKQIPICHDSFLDSPGIYAFLGQTGVGKTTTIAKLAAQYVLKHGAGKVALVTTDTYRVGAFDQLRTMGRILNVPVKVVDKENSLLTVLSSLRKFPLILIDTAGFRLGDPLLKAQLDQLEVSSKIKRVLVMACNSQVATMKASVHAHKGKNGLHACVLTKLDESATIGEAVSVVMTNQLPVAYTTDGQDIPKDIAQATGPNLVAKAVSVAKGQYAQENVSAG